MYGIVLPCCVIGVLISPATGTRAQQILLFSFRFQGSYHSESTYLEKAPTVQLARIDAADRLFSMPLTRVTGVPECAVSSVGFLWGSAPYRGVVGFCGLVGAP